MGFQAVSERIFGKVSSRFRKVSKRFRESTKVSEAFSKFEGYSRGIKKGFQGVSGHLGWIVEKGLEGFLEFSGGFREF